MMIIDYRTAMYLMGVAGALEDERVPAQYLTDVCTECNDKVGWSLSDSDPHVVMPVREYATPQERYDANDWRVYVVIACEGYWMIPPTVAGVDTGSWQDWTHLPDDVTPDDFE